MSGKLFDEQINIYSPHAKLAQAILSKTKTWESVFASKWLHFNQKEAFPIIDSISEEALFKHQYIRESISQWKKEYDYFHDNLKKDREDYDDRYCWYCFCLLQLRKHIAQKLNKVPKYISVKKIDIYLFIFDKK